MLSHGEIALRLVLASLLGGAIGLERERRGQPAGFRTHLILCIGSALIMLVSLFVAWEGDPLHPSDPGRIAAQVVSGVGFLCAGAILRIGVNVKGLTTAASLWTASGIGLAIGAGYIFGGALATGLILFALTLLSRFEKAFLLHKGNRSVTFTAIDVPGLLGKVEEILQNVGASLRNVAVDKNALRGTMEVRAEVEVPPGLRVAALTDLLEKIPEIRELEIL